MKIFRFCLFALFTVSKVAALEAIHVAAEKVCKTPYKEDAILRQEEDFVADFLTLHSLLRMAKPRSVFEIGTCTGAGTLIIKNAVGDGVVYSLDLPPGESTYDLPRVGELCSLPYVQLIGNSQSFDYSGYHPIDAWFIDGAHDYVHVVHETKQALLSNPVMIVWHDADVPEVFDGIKRGLSDSDYDLYRVDGTRVAFAIPRLSPIKGMIHD